MSQRPPKPAQCEDYDSDESSVKPGTAVQAKSAMRQASNKGLSQQVVSGPYIARHDSHQSSPVKSRPVIVQRESTQSSRSASRTSSKTRQNAKCTDPRCGDPDCASAKNMDRRFTMPSHQQYQVNYANLPQAAPLAPQYQYTQTAAPQVPVVNQPQPRPRTTSVPQSRPMSYHAGMSTYPVQYSYQPVQQTGPPPSPSAYRISLYAPNYAPPLAPYPTAQPIGQNYPANIALSPVRVSPTEQRPALPHSLSARTATISYATNVQTSQPMSSQAHPTLSRTLSARTSARTQKYSMPGSFVETSSSASDSASSSESDSASEYSEDDRHRRRASAARRSSQAARDRELMPPPSRPAVKERRTSSVKERRPSITHSKTLPIMSARTSREPLRRAPYSDPYMEESSDQIDSDRTARAVVDRHVRDRGSTYSSSSSRRPSVSTQATTSSGGRSGRTKATTISSGSDNRGAAYIIEDRHGRRRVYLSKENEDLLLRSYEQRNTEENMQKAKAYQEAVNSVAPPPVQLTAENIRKQSQGHARHGSASAGTRSGAHSHISNRSHHSGRSSKVSKTETGRISIKHGDAVLEVSGDATVEIKPGEDGKPGTVVVTSAAGKEAPYHGGSSRSSESRLGRTRSQMGRDRRNTIREEE